MPIATTRRAVIRALTGTCAAASLLPPDLLQQPSARVPVRPAPLADELVHDFVRAAHGDLDLTRQMLDDEPVLIRAAWDWGGGDFETALGGASHMGRRDIATLLLERGAPLDLFAAAMLGELSTVRAALEARPGLVHVPGPHGIPLMSHAKAGGPAAAPVFDYISKVLEPGG